MAASTTQENIFYVGDVLRDHTPYLVDMLGDTVTNGAFDSWEVSELIEAKAPDHEHPAPRIPDAVTLEAIHQAAYGDRTLGRSVSPQASHAQSFDHITPALLQEYAATYYQPGRMVVGAVGVDHARLVDLVQRAFGHLKPGAPVAKEPAEYVGGEVRSGYDSEDGLAHFAVALQAPSLNDADLMPLCVLQMMLGGGLSFSAGGPGKGMHSRLYERVLNRWGWAHSANCFTSLFTDSALFGACWCRHATPGVSVLCGSRSF